MGKQLCTCESSLNCAFHKGAFNYTFNYASLCVQLLSLVQLFGAPWTVAYQTPLSMGFSRQAYWNGLPFPSPGDFPKPEIEPVSPALAGSFFTTEPPGKPRDFLRSTEFVI